MLARAQRLGAVSPFGQSAPTWEAVDFRLIPDYRPSRPLPPSPARPHRPAIACDAGSCHVRPPSLHDLRPNPGRRR